MRRSSFGLKLLAFALSVCMLLMYASCAKKDEPSGSSTGNNSSTSSSASQPPASGKSWEIDKTPITVGWFFSYDWYGKVFNPDTCLADAKILKDTGVTLKIEAGDVDKFNVLISTKSLPDLITTDTTASQRKLLEDSGMVAPLNPLIKDFAPDMNVPKSMLDWYKNKDGNTYCIASFYYGPERTTKEFGGMYVSHNKNFVRKDILDQLGMKLDDMKTKDGFIKALREVKAKKIKYNGKDVLPFMSLNLEFLAQQFGSKAEDKDGNWLSPLRQPEYLEALKFGNLLYNEGLMTDEEFTLNDQQKKERFSAGGVFAGVGWTGVHKDARKSLAAADPKALLLYCGQMAAPQGKKLSSQE